MRSEDDVPMGERYLVVEGHLSAKTRQTVRKGFLKEFGASSRICFVSCAYADLPIPREFDTAFAISHADLTGGNELAPGIESKHLASVIFTRARIDEAMDTHYHNLGSLPDGARSICVLDFPDGVPYMIDDLPTVKDWDESLEGVVLCSRDTLLALKQNTWPRR